MDFNFNGKKIVSGGSEANIKIWNIKEVEGFCIHTIDVYS